MQMATYGIQTRGVQPQGIVEVMHEQIMSLQTQKMDARWLFVRNVICKAKLWWSTCLQGVDFGVFDSTAKQGTHISLERRNRGARKRIIKKLPA
jgi:hypothetical protein